jgi:hypothetical protein
VAGPHASRSTARSVRAAGAAEAIEHGDIGDPAAPRGRGVDGRTSGAPMQTNVDGQESTGDSVSEMTDRPHCAKKRGNYFWGN